MRLTRPSRQATIARLPQIKTSFSLRGPQGKKSVSVCVGPWPKQICLAFFIQCHPTDIGGY